MDFYFQLKIDIEYNQALRDDIIAWLEKLDHPDRERQLFLAREAVPDTDTITAFILHRAGFQKVKGSQGRDYGSESDRLYTIKETAQILNIHPRTVTRWRDNGLIEHIKLKSGAVRIPYKEVMRLYKEKSDD